MRVAVVREARPGENRVALVPGLVAALTARGHDVVVEPGAGERALVADADWAGATIDPDAVTGADAVLSVQPLPSEVVRRLRRGAVAISLVPPDPAGVDELRAAGVTAYALELVPRSSRAQSMDALTSQSLVAGYRGAVVAMGLLPRFAPRTMTAAGTLPAAEVLVLGTGVAGLEAIATCLRLGATVRAYDVRPASAEEIRSLGAVALDLGLPPLEGARGYARELEPERARTQQERLAPHVARADVLITTAAVPGRPAPVLVTRAVVEAMRPGSVVVDLAAESGGNVEGVVAGEVVRVGATTVWGGRDVAGQLPGPASRLLAQHAVALLALAPGDEILTATRVTGGAR